MSVSCRYANKGCKYNITKANQELHEQDCRHRTFKCEGKVFADWKCDWVGDYENLENHFKVLCLEFSHF